MAISAEKVVANLPEKEVCDIFELSKIVGVSERTLREHLDKIEGKFYIGRLLRFHLPTTRQWFAKGGMAK